MSWTTLTMKVSKAKAAENREAILDVAASQIRERGFDKISVADVGKAAGLTHGALYSHFESKDLLKAEATKRAFDQTVRAFTDVPLDDFLQRYLSTGHRDHPGEGCPNSALAMEVWRQPEEIQRAFDEGLGRFINIAEASLSTASAEHGRDRALTMFAAMVGGLALSRAVRAVNEAESVDILRAVAEQLYEFAGPREDSTEAC